jgi:hypothetical protein
MGFEMSIWKQSHIYMYVLQLFTGIKALPPNAIFIKCYDFERPMNPMSYFVPFRIIILMNIILSFSDTALLSFLMICRNTVATFYLSVRRNLSLYGQNCFLSVLLHQMVLNELPHAFPICLRCLWSLLLSVLTQCSCVGLFWWGGLRDGRLPEDTLGALHCCPSLAWLQPRHD